VTSDSLFQFPQYINCNGTKRPTLCTLPYTRYLYRHINYYPRMPAARPQPSSNRRTVRYGGPASYLRNYHHRASLRAVPADPEALAGDTSRILLESQCAQLLLLLILRIYNIYRRCASSSSSPRFWKLQIPRSTKIGLIVRMSMTMLSAIVTIIKRTYLYLFTDTTDPRTSLCLTVL
jgi:hypothetical protein